MLALTVGILSAIGLRRLRTVETPLKPSAAASTMPVLVGAAGLVGGMAVKRPLGKRRANVARARGSAAVATYGGRQAQ